MEIEYLEKIHTLFLARSQIPVSDRLKVRMWHQNTCDAQEVSGIDEELRSCVCLGKRGMKHRARKSMVLLRIADQEQSRGHTVGLQNLVTSKKELMCMA